LHTNTALKELILANNWCTRSGTDLSELLARNATLESLDVSSGHITDDTLALLLGSLTSGANTTLKHLYLSFNEFGNEGAHSVATMLREGRNRLLKLSVQFNSFDRAGLRAMVESLASHVYLRDFYYWNSCATLPDQRGDTDCETSSTRGYDLTSTMEHWLALNRGGRQALIECPCDSSKQSLWPRILERANAICGSSALFHLLRERPDLVDHAVHHPRD
jgi:Leucine Rich repeat